MITTSWGNYPKPKKISHKKISLQNKKDFFATTPVLPYGQGRSYGDVCLNEGGVALDTQYLNNFISFDSEKGILCCESGVTLAEILRHFVPLGWMPAVMPGTKFVSIGGAIANDVHGKNHFNAGSFGCHIIDFKLLRSDQKIYNCSATENPELFAATIGGLGLTGLITQASIKLKRIPSPYLATDTLVFNTLDNFFTIAEQSDISHEYTAAWLDCVTSSAINGKGLFMRANPCANAARKHKQGKTKSVPFYFPNIALNQHSIKLFNKLYFEKNKYNGINNPTYYDGFFFPLDGILHWNKIYGKRGFLQYQCVVPKTVQKDALKEILNIIVRSKQGSFLSVLKTFGNIQSPGLLSFPMCGTTLALDFPIRGDKTFKLLDRLDQVVLAAGGRIYPAKDARMSASSFHKYFHNIEQFKKHIDPAFSSSFWRRINNENN